MPAAQSIPTTGQPLPRADEAYAAPEKWDEWILADRGHGREWAYVFHAGPGDADRVWRAITEAVQETPIASIREIGEGIGCQVDILLTINNRTSKVRSVWHYATPIGRPRLISAFPTR
jgi:hypothetical protein